MKCEAFYEFIALNLENDLPESRRAELDAHLTSCESCRKFERELRESQSAVKELRTIDDESESYRRIRQRVMANLPQQRISPWFTFRWGLAVAALLVVAVAAASVFWRTAQPEPQISQVRPANEPAKPAGPPQDPLAVQPPAPESEPRTTSRPLPPPPPPAPPKSAPRTEPVVTGDYQPTEIAPRSEELTVFGETPVVDTKKTGNVQAFGREHTQSVPDARDPWVVKDQTSRIDSDRYNAGGSESTGQAAAASREFPTPPPGLSDTSAWNHDGVNAADPNALGASPTYFDFEAYAELIVVEQNQLGKGDLDTAKKNRLKAQLEANQRKLSGALERTPVTEGTLRARNAEGNLIGDFPLKHTEVAADISGYLAQTVVKQEYTNPYTQVIEAVYVFPLPSMAAVHDFVMEIGDRKILGVVRPREEAERIYREARERGQTASLLTQERPNIFTQNVANIEPGGSVTIKITYYETLRYEKGAYEYVFPMVVGPRYIPGNAPAQDSGQQQRDKGTGTAAPTDRVPDADRITPPVMKPGERSGHDIGLTARIRSPFPIRDVKSTAHKVSTKTDGDRFYTVKLSKADTIPNRDFVLRWNVDGDRTQFGMLAHRRGKDGFFTLMMQPTLDPSDAETAPREITFIMDISGSMAGVPIETSKEVIRRSLDRMRPDDIFNIVFFASGNGQLWESPQPNTPENLEAARAFLQQVRGGGGTEMLAGLKRALGARHLARYLQMYVFLTDGYIGNEAEILRTVTEERGEARFFAFGIGSSVNRYLIDGIGANGGGASHVVLPRDSQSAQKAADRFFECIDSPVLVDVNIDWNGLPVREVYPQKPGDLFAGRTIELVGRYARPAKGTIYIQGRVGARQVRIPLKVDLPESESGNEPVEAVWARHKIEDLSHALLTATADARDDLVRSITDIGVDFRLVTQYTSFVAVDESRIVGDGTPMKVIQPVEMPEDVSQKGVFGRDEPAYRIGAWGMTVALSETGQLQIVTLDPKGVAAQSGVNAAAVLVSLQGSRLHGMRHMESLLLQCGRGNVEAVFEPGGSILLPCP